MISKKQKEQARTFLNMHYENNMFLLPNVWNAGSAYVFEKQGFRAVATSSAGVAYDLGYPDGEDISFEDLLGCVERIAHRLDIPLSVDFERGYGDTPIQVQKNARRLIYAGAVGFNIEDGMPDGTLNNISLQTDKIKALAELKQELDIDFVINARTCVYWLNVSNEEDKLKIAMERSNAFREAGADCIFIPGAIDEATVIKLVKGVNSPINIILNSKFSDFKRLDEIGVRRLSVGSSPARLIYQKLNEVALDLKNGNVPELINNTFSYDNANQYFTK